MDRRVLPISLLLATVLAGLLATPVSAQDIDQNWIETYEDDEEPEQPTHDKYTFTSGNVVTLVTTAQEHAGNQSQAIRPTAAGPFARFTYPSGVDYCTGTAHKLWFYMPSLPPAGQTDVYTLGSTTTTVLTVTITDAGALLLTGTTVTGVTVPTATWIDIQFGFTWSTTTGCAGSAQNGYPCIQSATLTLNFCNTPSATNNPVGTYNRLQVAPAAASPFSRTLYIDDHGPQIEALEAGSRFCANVLDEPEFGYEFTDGIRSIAEAEDDNAIPGEAQFSMEDGFFMAGSDEFDSWDITAKHFNPGSKAFHVFFQIEAGIDSTESTFRAAFTLNNNAVPTLALTGNGLDTQLFDEQYEVQFRENGNDWQIQLFKAEAGGNRASQGPAVNTGNPNNPEVYSFWLDTRAGYNYAAVKNSAGAVLINTTSATVPDLPASFSEDTIYTQWFLGYGNGQVLGVDVNAQALTELNDNKGDTTENSGDSTCIFDDVGTSVVGTGGAGTAPASSVIGNGDDDDEDSGDCTGVLCVDTTTVPDGFTVVGFNAFLGLLFVGTVAVGGTFAVFGENTAGKGVGVVFSIFAVLGYLIALMMDLVPLWPVIGVIVVGGAIMFLKLRSSG